MILDIIWAGFGLVFGLVLGWFGLVLGWFWVAFGPFLGFFDENVRNWRFCEKKVRNFTLFGTKFKIRKLSFVGF